MNPTRIPFGLRAGLVDCHGDHRMAMSLAILGCFNLYADGSPWMKIRNPACCAKTFPKFFKVLEDLRNNRSQ